MLEIKQKKNICIEYELTKEKIFDSSLALCRAGQIILIGLPNIHLNVKDS